MIEIIELGGKLCIAWGGVGKNRLFLGVRDAWSYGQNGVHR